MLSTIRETTPLYDMENEPERPTTLLQRIADGDESAVTQCLDRYGNLVWSIARRMCPSDAEDATQEIFVEIWQKAATFDPSRAGEATFITMIARRRLIDRIRRNGSARHGAGVSGTEDPETIEIASVQSIDQLELADEAAKAANCMTKLSDRQQQILTLSIHQGVSHSGISSRLSIPLGTVKSFARRALIQLRDCMSRPAAGVDGGLS